MKSGPVRRTRTDMGILCLLCVYIYVQTNKLRLKLLKSGIKKHVCEQCNNSEWLSQSIPLELHHIDGDCQNNNILNLQLLCPNCHALTPNYRGKNKKKTVKKIINDETILALAQNCYTVRHLLLELGLTCSSYNYNRIKDLQKNSNLKLKEKPRSLSQEKRLKTIIDKYGHIPIPNEMKIDWPEKNILIDLLTNNPCSKIAKNLGVSCSAVRKKAIKYGINIKDINPWSKKHGRC